MTESRTLVSRTAGNENTALIKIIAILFMLVDHAGVVLFNPSTGLLAGMPYASLNPEMPYNLYYSLRALGRIGMPLFCWGIVVGTEYTRNIWKYLLRIAVVGVISQPCFMLGLNHEWNQLNVFPTLGLGVLAIAGIKTRRFGSQIILPVLALLVSMLVQMDYGWVGVGLILVLYACRKSRGALAAGFLAYCLFMGRYYGSYPYVFGLKYSALELSLIRFGTEKTKVFDDMVRLFFQVEFWAVVTLPLILIPMRSRVRIPKWIGYGAYPFHLLVLGVIRHWGEITQFFSNWDLAQQLARITQYLTFW